MRFVKIRRKAVKSSAKHAPKILVRAHPRRVLMGTGCKGQHHAAHFINAPVLHKTTILAFEMGGLARAVAVYFHKLMYTNHGTNYRDL